MAGVKVAITGDKEVDRKLATLEEKIQKKLLKKALRSAAKVVAQEMKNRAPVDKGDLKGTIVVRAAKRSRKNKHIVSMRALTDPKKLSQIQRSNNNVVNPFWTEYGTATGSPAQPYARPAMDAKKTEVVNIFRSEMKTVVDEATREK